MPLLFLSIKSSFLVNFCDAHRLSFSYPLKPSYFYLILKNEVPIRQNSESCLSPLFLAHDIRSRSKRNTVSRFAKDLYYPSTIKARKCVYQCGRQLIRCRRICQEGGWGSYVIGEAAWGARSNIWFAARENYLYLDRRCPRHVSFNDCSFLDWNLSDVPCRFR
jgi:hypothetical protein